MKATLRGASFHFEDQGSGDPLLLVHAFPLDHTLWTDQIETFSDTHRVIAPDLRGFGRSADAPSVVTMEDHAADLVALLDELDIGKVGVCGLSMGGYIAMALLQEHPERVKSVILCNTRAVGDSNEARRSRLENADRAERDGPDEIAAAMLPKMLSAKGLEDPALRTRVRSMMTRQRGGGVAAALRGMAARPDRTPLLERLAMPALVIAGDQDVLIPEAECRAMAETIPGAHYVVLRGAGHLSNLDDPAAFNAALRNFIG